MASSLIIAGLGMATIGFGARYIMRAMPKLGEKMANVPKIDSQVFANSKYYKGGFEPKMTKREAALVLGISPSANPAKLKAAYKRLILINHPDKGGSPYLSAKISEAKDLLDKK
ncbi:UNVERIFIED_CONTAM: hypothetical protein RMT77_001619 [Armadillidium vulgare]|nr:Mitochondrial import inner membrane translocase subunit TIM14 [Armadillidium vulgare]